MSAVPLLFVIDGANATGKTSLANALVARLGPNTLFLHQTHRFKDRMFEYHTAVIRRAQLALAQGRSVVLDRLWLTEAIYGHVYRGGTRWPHQGRFVDRLLLKLGGIQVITIDPDPERLFARFKTVRASRTDTDAERNNQVNALFATLELPSTYVKTLKICLRAYPWHHGDNLDDLVQYALQTRLMAVMSPRVTQVSQNVIGCLPIANTLMVGDQLNPKNRLLWPFYEYGNCSLWLAERLHALNINEAHLAWVNSRVPGHPREEELVPHILMAWDKKIVALGLRAAERLSDLGIKNFKFIDHPQHGRRFHHDGKAYEIALAQALGWASSSSIN